jgi:hypothetical protein
MAGPFLRNMCQQVATTSGTGTFSLAAAVAPYDTISAKVGDGNTGWYVAKNATQKEWGIGTAHTGTPDTFTRTTVKGGDNGTSPVNFTSPPTVQIDLLADLFPSPFAPNGLLFGTAEGGIGQDAGSLYWDDVNNILVVVGSVSPLVVIGPIGIFKAISNDVNGTQLRLAKTRNDGPALTGDYGGDFTWQFTNSASGDAAAGIFRGYIANATAGSEEMDYHFYLSRAGAMTLAAVLDHYGRFAVGYQPAAPLYPAYLAVTQSNAVAGVSGTSNYLTYTGTGYKDYFQDRSFCDYRPTTIADPFTIGHVGRGHTTAYGDQGGVGVNPTAASGSAIGLYSGIFIRNCSQYESEHAPVLFPISYDNNNNNFGNTTPGRGWMADLDLFGCMNMQQSALGGVHMFLNNYYNGPPRDALSVAYAAVSLPGSGAYSDAYHQYGPTYQLGSGYAAVGFTSGGVTRAFESGFQAGGVGTNWGAQYSHVGSGFDAADFDYSGLVVRNRFRGVNQVHLTVPGSGYTTPPTVTFSGGGSSFQAAAQAELTATTVSRTVSTNKVTSPGSGYSASQKVRVTYSDPTPWGAPAVGYLLASAAGIIAAGDNVLFNSSLATITIDSVDGSGAITGITLTGNGAGYPINETAPLAIEKSGNRTAWCTAATNSSGLVTAVSIQTKLGRGSAYTTGAANCENTGTGYTRLPAAAVAASPTGDTPVVGTVVLQATSVGLVKVVQLGNGYTSQPTIAFTGGGGSGAEAVAVVLSMNPLPEIKVSVLGAGYAPSAPPAVTVGTSESTGGICTTSPHPTATVTAGVITALGGTATGGTGFLANQTPGFVVRLVGQTSGARNATALITTSSTGTVATAVLKNGGSGYTSGEVLHYVGYVDAVACVPLGQLTNFVVINQGAGFVAAPTVTIAAPSPVTATATSTQTAGALTAVTVTNKGTAYWSGPPSVQLWVSGATAGTTGGLTVGTAPAPTATVTAGVITALGGTATGGTGYIASLTFTARLVGQTSNASNATVSLTTNGSGVITTATLLTGGSGYTSGETLRYVGLGSAVATVYFGQVDRITIGFAGAGYNANPSVVLSAPPAGSTATAKTPARYGGFGAGFEIDSGPIIQESGDPAAPYTGLNLPYFDYVRADATTTSTTAADITGNNLSFSIGANEVWSFEAHLKVGSSSSAGTKHAIAFPAGATVVCDFYGTTTNNGVFAQERASVSGTLTTTAWNTTSFFTTTAVGAFVQARGLVIAGTTPGVVKLQHAKVTSGTATVYANSYIVARRVK